MNGTIWENDSAAGTSRYALFVSIPLVGHMNPQLRQAEELARRGWRVAMASTTEARSHVEGQGRGVSFVDLGPMGPLQSELKQIEAAASLTSSFTRYTAKFTEIVISLWPAMYDGLCAAVESMRPDVMIVNMASFAGMDAAANRGIPLLVNSPYLLASIPDALLPPARDLPPPYSGRSIREIGLRQRLSAPVASVVRGWVIAFLFGRKLNAYRRSRGLASVDIHTALKDTMILANTAFGVEYSRPLPPLVQMVGPMVSMEIEPLPQSYRDWLDSGPPVVYANLGTLAVASSDQLSRMLSGFQSDAFRVLWVLRKEQLALLPPRLPVNLRVESWVPSPQAILSHENVRVFVSHCGINSAQESLLAGTPIVGIPIMGSQRDMAMRVKDAGVGLVLHKSTFTGEELNQAILRVMQDDAFRRNIPAIQSSFRLAGGVRRAADLIEHVASVGCAHYARGWSA